MDRLRGRVDTNDMSEDQPRASRVATPVYRHPLHCGACGDLFYVDDRTLQRVERAVRYDPSDAPFTCDACEEAYFEEGQSRG